MDDGIVLFELWDANGKKVASFGDSTSLEPKFQTDQIVNFTKNGLRNAYRKNSNGSVRLVIKEHAELFQGNKAITRACTVYLTLVPKLERIIQSERQHSDTIIRRFAHNLTRFQRRFKESFSNLVPDKARGRIYNELLTEVKQRIQNNIDSTADAVTQMSHRATDLDAQIEALRILSGYADESAPTTPLPTDLRRAIYRLSNAFVKELNKRNVSLELNIPTPENENQRVLIIHSLFNTAIWSILDNACKYVLEGTTIKFSAILNSLSQSMRIEMVSVCIEADEYEKIFQEKYKGRNSGAKAGSGIGMFLVRKALTLMDASINVENIEFVCNKDSFPYCRHIFEIKFKNRINSKR